MSASAFDDRVSALRRAFDETFASPPVERATTDDYVSIRVAGAPFALRLCDIARLSSLPKIVPVPTALAHALGVASLRGRLVAVHSLAIVLGYVGGTNRWIVQCAEDHSIGLAFEHFEGFVRLTASAVHEGVARTGDVARRIVDVKALLITIDAGAGEVGAARSDT